MTPLLRYSKDTAAYFFFGIGLLVSMEMGDGPLSKQTLYPRPARPRQRLNNRRSSIFVTAHEFGGVEVLKRSDALSL